MRDKQVATQIATQSFGIGWHGAASAGIAVPKNEDKSGLGGISRDRLGPPQRFPKPKVGGSSPLGTAKIS
jgi:hypothetical protein